MNKAAVKDVRAAAALVLMEVLVGGRSLSTALPLQSQTVPERDKALLQELCFGCLRYYPKLQLILETLIPKPLKAKDGDINGLLLLGLYQLDYTRIPDHAAISATVEASKTLKKDWASKLINGVLRTYLREKTALAEKFAKNPQFNYAHPQWLLDKLRAAWPEDWQALMDANNSHPPFTLRVNQQRHNRENYLQQLAQAEIAASSCRYSPVAITLEQAVAVNQLPNFSEGHCSVQDESAQLAAYLLDLQPGQNVLDACCAPGGKSSHILETEPRIQNLTAIDIDALRMRRVEENMQRLGLHATLVVADIMQVENWWNGELFDRILLDAPCSATGVIRRHPDIKVLRRASDINVLAKLQLALLTKLWECLKPGGLLVYATCSMLPDENTKVIAAFMAKAMNAEHAIINADWGIEQPFGRQLLPHLAGQDGFYYAVLRKQIA